MQGDGYDQVGQHAEKTVTMMTKVAFRLMRRVLNFVFNMAKAVVRGIQYGIREFRNERERLLRGDGSPAIGSEQGGRSALGEFGQAFEKFFNGGFRTQQSAREHTASTTDGRKESEREHNKFDSTSQDTSRDRDWGMDENIQRRWGPDATFEKVWQEGLKEGGIQTAEDAVVVWGSATTIPNPSPEAKEARENAEAVLRADPSTSEMMEIYDQNIGRGIPPWASMAHAYRTTRPETNTTQTTYTAQERPTDEQNHSQTTDQSRQHEDSRGRGTQRNPQRPDQPEDNRGRGTQRNPQRPDEPEDSQRTDTQQKPQRPDQQKSAVPVGAVVGAGKGPPSAPSNRPNPVAPTQGPRL